jgi:hypothetical protein
MEDEGPIVYTHMEVFQDILNGYTLLQDAITENFEALGRPSRQIEDFISAMETRIVTMEIVIERVLETQELLTPQFMERFTLAMNTRTQEAERIYNAMRGVAWRIGGNFMN